MPSDSTYYDLKLYNSTTDGTQLFATFRADQAGTASTSNMNIIDAALHSHDVSIADFDDRIVNGVNIIVGTSVAGITTATGNIIIGDDAANILTSASNNVIIGKGAAPILENGLLPNVVIGYNAGPLLEGGATSSSVFIGPNAGKYEDGVVGMFIVNGKGDGSTPLIYAGFENETNFSIFLPYNTTSPMSGFILYAAEDVSGTGGNIQEWCSYPNGGSRTSHLAVDKDGNLKTDTITGAKICTSKYEKLGFWNATPIVQPTTAVAEATFVENSGGTAVNVDSTFGGYTLQQIAKALQNIGLLA